MKIKMVLLALMVATLDVSNARAQSEKYPGINLSGQIFDQYGNVLGWISKEGVVQNAIDNKIAVIDKEGNALDAHGQRIGKMSQEGAFHDAYGSLLFTLTPVHGGVCEMLDPRGKKIGLVNEHFRKQACAILVLFARMKTY